VFFINQGAEMGVMHRIITVLVTLPDLTICPAGKRDGKRGSIVS